MSGNVEIELTGAGKDRKLVVRNNSDAVVTISADLAGLLAIPTAPAPNAPTAYCATCGHDHPVDERDYPGEPERVDSGLTGAGINQFIEEWRRQADELDDKLGDFNAGAAVGLRRCADAIDPMYQHKFPTENGPTLPDEPVLSAAKAAADLAKEWRRRADQLDSTGNSWAASASGVYRYCANEIDPTRHREFPTTPTLPNDEPSYTVEDVVAMVDHLPSLLKMRAGITKDEIRAFVKNFKNK